MPDKLPQQTRLRRAAGQHGRQAYMETSGTTMSKNRSTQTAVGVWVASGIALGATLGAAFGDVAIGVALGVAIGASIGAAMSKRSKDDSHHDAA